MKVEVMMSTRTVFRENNSGGSWWLSYEQWAALRADPGWTDFERRSAVFLGSEDAAIESFERITGEKASTIGCTCCGRPFNFYRWYGEE